MNFIGIWLAIDTDHASMWDVIERVPSGSAHHKSAHRGALLVSKHGDELVFEHADGYELGDPRSSLERCQVLVAAFEVLVSRGFYETEARRHLDGVRTAVRIGDSVARVLALADQARRCAA